MWSINAPANILDAKISNSLTYHNMKLIPFFTCIVTFTFRSNILTIYFVLLRVPFLLVLPVAYRELRSLIVNLILQPRKGQ